MFIRCLAIDFSERGGSDEYLRCSHFWREACNEQSDFGTDGDEKRRTGEEEIQFTLAPVHVTGVRLSSSN